MATVFTDDLPDSVELNVKEILGYPCDLRKAMGSRVYSIHGTGVSLLSETDFMGIQIKSAVVAIETVRVDSSLFELPEGIAVEHNQEADWMAQMIAQQAMTALKDHQSTTAKQQGFMGSPSSEPPEIPEEDKLEMEEAIKTIRGLLGD